MSDHRHRGVDELTTRLAQRDQRAPPIVGIGFVTDFGPVVSVFFADPEVLEAEVCVPNPDAVPDRRHPPGTAPIRFADG